MSFILNIIPRGIQSWFKFMTTEEVETLFNKYNAHKTDVTGYFQILTPIKSKFIFTKNTSIAFAIQSMKNVKCD